jgi:ribosomal protein S24E
MGQVGTVAGYSQRVPKSRYNPTPEVAEHVTTVVGLFRQRQEIEDEYRRALAQLASAEGDAVPIAYIAEQLGVERKTVYRHLGRSMT